jgi:carboxypeptidase D
MKSLKGYRTKLLVVGFVFCSTFALPKLLAGQIGKNDTDSTGITAAGPRLGTIVVVEVTIPNRDALDRLAREGYDISNVQGNVATIYASLEELERLKQTGYPLREIERQSRPEGFDIMALGGYHSYAALTDELSAYAEANSDICRLYTLGQSVQGRELWAVLITDNPDDEEDEPEFKYVSTMHGDEPVGTEMCLYFIDLLLKEYGQDDLITNLVNSTAIWIVPLMNPDGLELGRRANANGMNLNRSFPQLFGGHLNVFDGGLLDASNRQPEVRHIMNWTAENSFVLSANFHTGALVVNYPYDNDGKGSVYSASPDDQLFIDISMRYSMHNSPMWNSTSFPNGITNGAAWYAISGGMQDWNYRYMSCNEVTIELSNNFSPSASQIPAFWADNKESMLSFLETIHMGVRGLITDRGSGDPLWSEVWVEGNSQPVFTDPNVGDYHRMLLPGTYDLVFHVPGYVPRAVRDISVTDGPASRVDIELIPEQASPDFNHDRKVDIEDLLKLIEHWGQDEPSVDIAPLPYGDGVVDSVDLDLFMEYWQEEIPIPEIAPYLIARWKLDEAEGDIAYNSIGDNHGILSGNPTWQPDSGQVTGALEFDGIDDYVETGFVLNPADGAFSVFAWIKDGAPGQAVLLQADGSNWLCLDSVEGYLMTELKGSGRSTGDPLLSEAIITDGNWHRIGLVWDGSHRHLYVDGTEVANDAAPLSALGGAEGGLYFGVGSTLAPGTYFSGLIDDVHIYNRAVKPYLTLFVGRKERTGSTVRHPQGT